MAHMPQAPLPMGPDPLEGMPFTLEDFNPRPESYYAALHCDCFFPAKLGPSAATAKERKQRPFMTSRRSTESVRAGADRGDIDDVLEYGIRLTTGLDVSKDPKGALELFLSIGQGHYPPEKRAIAYSIASHSAESHVGEIIKLADVRIFTNVPYEPVKDDYASVLKAGEFANHAARLGLFSWASATFVYSWDGGLFGRKWRKDLTFGGWKYFWDGYDAYRLETGT
ncbi:hypothetical protein BDZ94DRAFT_1313708 [Collybia nuda]|uniref:Uncharacterized protein n=1 Tax=Collybia nuda TaxID=64659 RepID=A0A9P6CA24_9AGAR|nr:hypothetical protein BDZ94DRAFT_1313708 [Collybia nuda]